MIFNIPDIIKKKRDGEELSGDEIDFFIKSVVDGTASDGQIGAWLMAVYINGMSDAETSDVTYSMVINGDRLTWDPAWDPILVDKHSTGGIGDKISLVLAPALAASGLKVPMMSGRGLGFTGGTLDKLESIPGFRVLLSRSEMFGILRDVGCFIAGQTEDFAPADRALYRLRDVTRTVDCVPLIVSSILSKKAVEGTRGLVVDVKVGCGSLVADERLATELSNKLIDVSKQLGISTSVVVTDMNTPLGRCIGNALEVIESVECLRNGGPDEIRQLVQTLGGVLLAKTGLSPSVEEGGRRIAETLADGRALSKFRDMIIRQGVSERDAEEVCRGRCSSLLPIAGHVTRLRAAASGIITTINAEGIGKACWLLGAGRCAAGAEIDHGVGVKLLKLTGDSVQAGDEWLEVYHSEEKLLSEVETLIQESLTIEPVTEVKSQSRIIQILGL